MSVIDPVSGLFRYFGINTMFVSRDNYVALVYSIMFTKSFK